MLVGGIQNLGFCYCGLSPPFEWILTFLLTFLYDPFTVPIGRISLDINLELKVDLEEIVQVNGFRRRTRKRIRA